MAMIANIFPVFTVLTGFYASVGRVDEAVGQFGRTTPISAVARSLLVVAVSDNKRDGVRNEKRDEKQM